MNATTQNEQATLEGMPEAPAAEQHMIARVNAVAVKMVFPFAASNDIRYYLNGINIRPLDDGSVMIVATNGHRYIVVRDPHGYAEREMIVSISKDGLKHANNAKHTLDVMSNGSAMFSDSVAQPLFIQPGNSLVEGVFPRIERVASTIGYREGITGAVNPAYLADALAISKATGNSIRFFTRDNDSPLNFIIGGLGELECFGGIMKIRDTFDALPAWFPAPGEVTTLETISKHAMTNNTDTLVAFAATSGATRFWTGTDAAGKLAQFWTKQPNAAGYPGLAIAAHVIMPLNGAGDPAGWEPAGAAPALPATAQPASIDTPEFRKVMDRYQIAEEEYALDKTQAKFDEAGDSYEALVTYINRWAAALQAPVPAASEGWVKNTGREPLVEVELRDGTRMAHEVSDYEWKIDGEHEPGDIIRCRLTFTAERGILPAAPATSDKAEG